MNKNFSLPPISITKSSPKRKSNSLSVGSLGNNVKGGTLQNYYVDLAKLSARADYLKQENEILKEELCEIVTEEEQTDFHRIKKSILSLNSKLMAHEKDADDVIRALSLVRKAPSPTSLKDFIPLNKDLLELNISTNSFLMHNPQKGFFSAEMIKNQNEEIKKAIKMSNLKLNKSRKILSLYNNCQTENGITQTIESLKKGENPLFQADTALGELKEQEEKIRVLREELKQLVIQRKKLELKNTQKETSKSEISPPVPPKVPICSKTAPRPKLKQREPQNKKKEVQNAIQSSNNEEEHEIIEEKLEKEEISEIFAENSQEIELNEIESNKEENELNKEEKLEKEEISEIFAENSQEIESNESESNKEEKHEIIEENSQNTENLEVNNTEEETEPKKIENESNKEENNETDEEEEPVVDEMFNEENEGKEFEKHEEQILDHESDASECKEDELLPKSPTEEDLKNEYNEYWRN